MWKDLQIEDVIVSAGWQPCDGAAELFWWGAIYKVDLLMGLPLPWSLPTSGVCRF